jgi:iron(III) transport system substrate-binding protein
MRLSISGLILVALLAAACAPAAQPAATGTAPTGASPSSSQAAPGPQPEWQQEWDRTVAAARQEGKVVVNGPPGDRIRRGMVENFGKAFPGISLEWSGGRSTEQATKLDTERRAGIYSVDVGIGGTTTATLQLKPLGAVEPLRPALILPEAVDPKYWYDNRLDFSDTAETNLVFVSQAKALVVYDPSQVRVSDIDELPKLLDPKWRGKIVINDPIPAGGGQATFRWLWEVLGPDKAPDAFRALRAQAGSVDRDQRRQVEWVARGRYPMLFGGSDGVIDQLLEEGVKAEVLPDLKELGTYISASFGSVVLINRAPHPNAAKVFINWLLSKDGQTTYSTAMGQASRRLDVPSDHLEPYTLLKPGVRYWANYYEVNQVIPPAMQTVLTEVFGSN